jgi:hypothetical protein
MRKKPTILALKILYSCLLLKIVKTGIQKIILPVAFVWKRNVVSHIKGRIQHNGVWQQGAEENILT